MAEIKDSDVTVLLERGGKVINANGGILQGIAPTLGAGMLGYMTLGGK